MTIVETERLRLRPHQSSDFQELAAMWADPKVVAHITGTPSTNEQSWSRLLRYAGHWAVTGYGYWAVEERATGRYIGDVGFADYKRTIVPSLDGIPELGWVLAPHAHGRGYATEAARAAIAWGDEHFGQGTTSIACIITPENLPSIRVAEKCGFGAPEQATYLDQPILLFRKDVRSQ
jgi:RimJ/RimL family protein N-acetyltransferase